MKLTVEKGDDSTVWKSIDIYDTFEITRFKREKISFVPEKAGIYILLGTSDEGRLNLYIGKSDTSVRNRILTHHKDEKRNWFGDIYVILVPSADFCAPIEAELIMLATTANNVAVVLENVSTEERYRESASTHISPIIDKIVDWSDLVFDVGLFTPNDTEEETIQPKETDISAPLPKLARGYRRGAAENHKNKPEEAPQQATHELIAEGMTAYGYYNKGEPYDANIEDKSFWVCKGSKWNKPESKHNNERLKKKQQNNVDFQNKLVKDGILNEKTMTFIEDYQFDNWNLATGIVKGHAHLSGCYYWRPFKEFFEKANASN